MNRRNLQLSKIHIAKKDQGLDDETYRALLKRVANVTSAKDLTPRQIGAVLAEFERLGWQPKAKPKSNGRAAPNVAPDRQKLVGKIEAFMAEAGRPWEYADGMALRMFKVERVEWLNAKQLGSLVSALTYDAQRNGRPTQ
ncbi:Mu-like prophage protein gp16 [Pseudomonas sp. NFPP10]|uniref:gp16 family protein n=1 Tax=Pseudomonas TaxID=286 RepID=UPI000883BC3B|nr:MULTISPECIES: regulatory protein GemA [Pseudomonas]SDA18170.1 Mu-like prophage protein gp16 [Pseudomonas sp. NFPP12]SEK99580.1 Mu-like prophage protein gp16 [Pseudomonas sp. NFPP10]SFI58328.1 Mu-like prophage protein gp16 [Pseudomonas sp. NFPP08]SFM43194.1 Mu-like prophage protein gp16 [Pseudomonas sp. NFPP05]SFX31649.1 Mu-like prophage protein gp16 [Pseudomonas sp. NFPP09]